MAKIDIVKSGNLIKIDFGTEKTKYLKSTINIITGFYIRLLDEDNGIESNIFTGSECNINWNKIFEIDGVAPTSNSDLFDKIEALL